MFKLIASLSLKINNGQSLKADVIISVGLGTLSLLFILVFLNSQTTSEEKDYTKLEIEVGKYLHLQNKSF